MEKEFPKHHNKIVLTCLMLLLAGVSTNTLSQENKESKKPGQEAKSADDKKVDTQKPIDMNEPSPLYLVVMKQWAITTNYASDSATVIVQKLKLAMEADPEIKRIVTPAFIADLQQFIYELFISNDAIMSLAKVYSQYFTIDEMQDLLAFYNTPLGKKLVKAEPQLVIKTQEVGMNLLKKNQRAYMELIAKYAGKPLPGKQPEASPSQQSPAATAPAPATTLAPTQPTAKPEEPFKPESGAAPQAVPPEVPPRAAPLPSKPAQPMKQEQVQPETPKELPPKAKEVKPEETWWQRLRSMIGV